MSAAPHLTLIDGEVDPEGPQTFAEALAEISDLNDQLKGAEKEIKAWRMRYAKLARDREADAQNHELWGLAVALYTEWRIVTGHMRSVWNVDRFDLCRPYLEKEGFKLCRLAIWGLAAHPNRKQITPGYWETYDAFELPFRNAGNFTRYANRGAAIFGSEPPQPAVNA